MCKTGTTPNRRPAALLAAAAEQMHHAEQQRPTSVTSTATTAPAFLQPKFFNPLFGLNSFNAGGSQEQRGFFMPHPSQAPPSFLTQPAPSPSWLQQQQQQQQALMSILAQQSSPVPGCIDLLTKPSLSNTALPSALMFDTNLFEMKKPSSLPFPQVGQQYSTSVQTAPAPQSSRMPSTLNMLTMTNNQDSSRKRPAPEMIPDSNSEHSSSDNEKTGDASKKLRASKKKHEATLDGERRVAIEFESFGRLGAVPQTYGKSALVVPDGLTGKYSAFGQRWRFTITHSVGPVICEDGVHRMCLAWSVTNLNSGHTHTVIETPTDAMKRDRDGKTLCNRVFRDALSLRASSLEAELRSTNDPSTCIDLQSQLRTIQTKRFSEGPLFFGLRHLSLQNEMKKEMEKRRLGLPTSEVIPTIASEPMKSSAH